MNMLKSEFHVHMNSQAIQSRHRAAYEELFQACPTVVSVPLALTWSPTYAVGQGGVGIVTKIPLRLYVGIEPTTSGKLEFGPVKYYMPERDEFQTWEFSRCNPSFLKILEFSTHRLGPLAGARLWILTEAPWYRGFSIDSAVGAAASAAWLLSRRTVNTNELAEMVRLPSSQLQANQAFDRVFRLSWKLDSVIAHWLSDAHVIYGMLVDSRYPTVFFRERDPLLFDQYRDYGLDHPSSYYNISDNLFFRGARLEELFQLDPDPAWPLDIAMLHIGEEGDSQFVYRTRGAFRARLEEASTFAAAALRPLTPETFREAPRFLTVTQSPKSTSAGMNLMQVYRETSVAHSLTVFKLLHDLFQYGATTQIMRDFLDAQNLSQDLLRSLGLSTLAVDRACMALRTAGIRHTEAGVAARLAGPGIFGCIQAIGPRQALEPCVEEAIQELRRDNENVIHCHWASWCDGASTTQGLRVDQHIEGQLYGDFTEQGKSVTVREWNGEGKMPTALLFTLNQWEKTSQRFDVVIDAARGKILVKGRTLTSSDIHSAKQTIDIFRRFFSDPVKEIPAAALPASCYKSDRNQMESKIVRPLAEVIHERTGKRLGLEVHGGLGSQYVIRFQPDRRLRLGFVEKE